MGPAVAKATLGPGFHWQHVEIGVTNDGASTCDVGSVFPLLLSAAWFVHLVDHINVESTQRLVPPGHSMQMGYCFLVSSSETSEMIVLTTFDNNTPALATQTQSFVWVV